MKYDAEILIAGAGPAGCATAIRLVDAGCDVLVIERDTVTPGADVTSGEVLSPMAQHELRDIGLMIEGDWVFDQVSKVRNVYPDLSWTLHGIPAGLEYRQIDRGGLNAACRRRLVEAGGRLECEQTVTGVDVRDDGVVLRTRDGHEFRAKMLIDAAGRHGPALTALKLKQPDPMFRQIGIAIFYESFDGTPLHTWDRHLYGEHGAMISGSRIHNGLYRYILEADLDDKQQRGMRPVEFYEYIAERYDPWIRERCMREPRVGDVWMMAPLAHRAADVTRDRLLLVGDAAGYLSPFTGQGIEIALRSARLAAETVIAAARLDDYSVGRFAPYVEGRNAEVTTLVSNLRGMLRFVRDRDALVRASTDDALRAQHLMPLPVIDRGTLRASITA